MNGNQLYRSRANIMIGGVCGGLGEYLHIDPTFVRLFFILLALGGNGIGVLIYFLLWIIVPLEGKKQSSSFEETVREGSAEIADRARAMGTDIHNIVRNPNPQATLIIGAAFIFLGVVFLFENLPFPWLSWLDYDVIWPVLLIVGGIALLTRNLRGES